MTLDEAIYQLNQMKNDGVSGSTKLSGEFSIGFQHYLFELDCFDIDDEDSGIIVCTKNIVQT